MIEFTGLNLTAPDGCIVGVIENGSSALSSAAVAEPNLILRHTLATLGSVEKSREVGRLLRLRRAGATIVIVSHDEILLESCADEIWWIENGVLEARGDPSEVLERYRRHVSQILRATGAGTSGDESLPPLSPGMRKGDGRAVLEAVKLSSLVFTSGEPATVTVRVRFVTPVADPVIGILIRTRVGLNVYGTNTELEGLKMGPVEAGDVLRVTYRFQCDLCPGHYTVTAASHDPDGVWHDWMEDAVAFAVTDSRYTAGVANLKAKVEFTRQ
ncbi:MAG TPA: Wzt carbohydrate-binding domain-containing protein [Bryobacteraceae bacterium]|jgi:lipopolysaccharide transport system ATP-binding protein|nr:Wzt carbohydrate-binding domain-containing protein [Bryobacteraceae bacterium]